MRCPDCKEELTMTVNVIMEIPSSMESLLSKKNIAKKEVKIIGADWNSAYYFCNHCYKGKIIKNEMSSV